MEAREYERFLEIDAFLKTSEGKRRLARLQQKSDAPACDFCGLLLTETLCCPDDCQRLSLARLAKPSDS